MDDQFVHDLLAVIGDCRLLWLPNLSDTTASSDRSRHTATITWSESLASFDAVRSRRGAGVAVAFNGSDEEGDLPDADRFSFGDGANDGPFSVGVLINPDAVDSAQSWLAKWDLALGREWSLEMHSTGDPMLFLRDESAGGAIARRVSTPLTAGSWTLLAATYDGSAAEAGIRIYKDGTRADDTSNSSGTYTAMENGSGAVTIAHNRGDAGGAQQSFFDGTIALAVVTARELSPDEMWTLKEHCNGYFGLDL